MDSPYYSSLMLPVNLCKEGVFESYAEELVDPEKNQMWRIEGNDLSRVLSEEGRVWLNSVGCRVDLVEMFYLAPHRGVMWHIDTNVTTPVYDYVKINYAHANNALHHMDWGVVNRPVEEKIGYNFVGSPHMQFEDIEIDLKDTTTITGPTIVNVGVPHRGLNESDEGVWYCCFIPKRGSMRLSFAEANETFRQWLLKYM